MYPLAGGSKTRQALRTVVRDLNAGHFFERTIWSRGIANQFGSIPVDLVQEGAVGRHPAIGRSAGDSCVQTSRGAISQNLRTRWIACDFEPLAVDTVAGDVAVAEIRRKHEAVVRSDTETAQ